MKYKINLLALLLLYCNITIAQGGAVINAKSGNASAVLDLSNNTSNKAFLPPRVVLTTLDNTTTPIANPANSLIVYNIGTSQLQGYYIFIDGVWSLIATRENSIMNATYENTANTVFANSTTFANLGGLTLVSDNSGGDILLTGGDTFTLKPGKYVFTVLLNIQNTPVNEPDANTPTPAISDGGKRTHSHFYTGRLWDGTATLGQNIQLNSISNTSGSSTDGRKHTASFNFSFEIPVEKTVTFQMARRAGASYTSAINIINTSVIIEKSLP